MDADGVEWWWMVSVGFLVRPESRVLCRGRVSGPAQCGLWAPVPGASGEGGAAANPAGVGMGVTRSPGCRRVVPHPPANGWHPAGMRSRSSPWSLLTSPRDDRPRLPASIRSPRAATSDPALRDRAPDRPDPGRDRSRSRVARRRGSMRTSRRGDRPRLHASAPPLFRDVPDCPTQNAPGAGARGRVVEKFEQARCPSLSSRGS